MLPNIHRFCRMATNFSCQYNSVLLQKAKNTLILCLVLVICTSIVNMQDLRRRPGLEKNLAIVNDQQYYHCANCAFSVSSSCLWSQVLCCRHHPKNCPPQATNNACQRMNYRLPALKSTKSLIITVARKWLKWFRAKSWIFKSLSQGGRGRGCQTMLAWRAESVDLPALKTVSPPLYLAHCSGYQPLCDSRAPTDRDINQ